MDHQPTFRSHRDIQLDTSQLSTRPEAERLDALAEWERHLDAGRIGKPRTPMSDEQLANLANADRIFRSAALYNGGCHARLRLAYAK